MDAFELAGVRAEPGTVARGRFSVGSYPDGSDVSVPFFVVQGVRPGPVLLLTAGLHGPEIPGPEAIRTIVRESLDPEHLAGTVIASPLLNPWGFHRMEMNTPQDGVNVNRVFPGSKDGTTSYQLAAHICETLLAACDALIDFHANPEPALQFAIYDEVEDPALSARAAALARAYGITCVEHPWQPEAPTGYLTAAAMAAGKPSITVELVSWRRLVPDATASAVRGTFNVMKHLGMLHGDPEPQGVPTIATPRLHRTIVAAHCGGMVHPLKEPGSRIARNEVIALIRDIYGDVVEELQSPVNGWILAWPWILSQAQASGDIAAFLVYDPDEDAAG